MNRKPFWKISTSFALSVVSMLFAFTVMSACKPTYRVTEISATFVPMDTSYDAPRHAKMQKLVNSYKTELSKEMDVIIGKSEQLMDYSRPESLLTNLTSDVMKAYGDEHLLNGADIAVMNVHGHRATLPEGDFTIGNLFEIYSFDNAITFLEVKGSVLNQIFDAFARIGGAGISGNVRLVIEGDKVKSVTVDGEPVDESRHYKVVTVDYLAEGNDNMAAFRDAITCTYTGVTLRDVMIDWMKEQTRQGKVVDSALDGRIKILTTR